MIWNSTMLFGLGSPHDQGRCVVLKIAITHVNLLWWWNSPVWHICKICHSRVFFITFLHVSEYFLQWDPRWNDTLQWRHNGRNGVSNRKPNVCLLNHLFRRRSQKTWKLRVTGPCEWNSPVTCEFPAQRASNSKNVSIWWVIKGTKFVKPS